jgi:ferredoxin-type protein NapH
LWLVVLGLFTKGGRGWCNFLCPAGALMGLFHSIGSWLGIGRSMRIDASRCKSCKTCIPSCSSWAISVQDETVQIDSHACNVCMDCAQVCPNAAIGWRAAMVKPAQKVQPAAG